MMLRGISKRIRPINFVHVLFKMAAIRLYFCSNFLKFTQKLHMSVLFISSKGAYNGNEEVIPSLIKFERKRLIFRCWKPKTQVKYQNAVLSFFRNVSLHLSREPQYLERRQRPKRGFTLNMHSAESSNLPAPSLSQHHTPQNSAEAQQDDIGRRGYYCYLKPLNLNTPLLKIGDGKCQFYGMSRQQQLNIVVVVKVSYCYLLYRTIVIYYCIAGLTKLNRSIRFTKGNHTTS